MWSSGRWSLKEKKHDDDESRMSQTKSTSMILIAVLMTVMKCFEWIGERLEGMDEVIDAIGKGNEPMLVNDAGKVDNCWVNFEKGTLLKL